MGRISDIVPGMYHSGENELIPFLRAFEPTVAKLERKIGDFASLVDVDRCPAEYLPYLAALTNVPLVGDDSRLWRRQIRNWPWLLKIKGTERSLAVFLQSIGAKEYTLHTWFRDSHGNFVEKKPQGEPFYNQSSGLWHNIRTHYFSIEIILDEEYLHLYSASQADIVEMILPWLERTKPFHAELLTVSVVPPGSDLEDHRCIYDVCHFSHGYLYTRDLGIVVVDSFQSGPEVDAGSQLFVYDTAAYPWSALYDAHRFGDAAFPPIRSGFSVYIGAVVRISDHGHIHRWHKGRSWRCGGTWKEDCCKEGVFDTLWTFARSTGTYGGDAAFGDINNTFSGGVEEIVPYIGAYGTEEFSGRAIDGPRRREIREFTEYIETVFVDDVLFKTTPEGGILWES